MVDSLSGLDSYIEKQKLFIARENGKKEKVEDRLMKNIKELDLLEENIELLEKVNILFQKTSEYAREQAKTQVETLVSKCLQFVFESEIEFKIEIEELRGRPSAKFFIVTKMEDKEIKLEPEHSKGGGVVDVVSLGLRIAFLETHKPRIGGPLILDEPAKHVSGEYIYNVSDFLKQNSELFDRQIIMVTHDNFLSAIGSTSYTVKIDNGTSFIIENEP